MLTGKGKQYWMTKSYEDDRQKALEDRSKYDDDELAILDLDEDISLGGGDTDEDTYEIKQFPFPVDQSIKSRKDVDIREVDPKI